MFLGVMQFLHYELNNFFLCRLQLIGRNNPDLYIIHGSVAVPWHFEVDPDSDPRIHASD
jgi:hypothetical protein